MQSKERGVRYRNPLSYQSSEHDAFANEHDVKFVEVSSAQSTKSRRDSAQIQSYNKHLRSVLSGIPSSARYELLKHYDTVDIPASRNSDYIFLRNEIKFKKFKDLMYQRQTEHRRKLVKMSMVYADKYIEMQKQFIREQFQLYSNANMGFLDSETKTKFAYNAVDVYEIDVNPQSFYERAIQRMDTDYEIFDRQYRYEITYANRVRQLELTMMGPKPNNRGDIASVKDEFKEFYDVI